MINPGEWGPAEARMPPPLGPVLRAEQRGIDSGIRIATQPPPWQPSSALEAVVSQQMFGWSSQPARPWWAESLLQRGVDPDWVAAQVGQVGVGLRSWQDVLADGMTLGLGRKPPAGPPGQGGPPVEKPGKAEGVDRAGHLGSSQQRWVRGMNEAFGQGYTMSKFPEMIKQANYPWWWGKVNGYRDIARNIEADIARTQRSKHIPDGLRTMIVANLQVAWMTAREIYNVFPR